MAGQLSCVEAFAATLYIVGLPDVGLALLQKFKWGPTFFRINIELLEAYAACEDGVAVIECQNEWVTRLQAEKASKGTRDLPPLSADEEEQSETEDGISEGEGDLNEEASVDALASELDTVEVDVAAESV